MIPCEQVESPGEFRYYIIATDDQGLSLAGAGSLKDPFKVTIKTKISGDPPSLPGKDTPKQCMAKGECPPGLLGCGNGGNRGDKVEGVSCDATPECQEGLVCKDGICTPGDDGTSKPKSGGKKNLVSLSVQFDVNDITDGTRVCDQGSSNAKIRDNALANYTCAVPDGYLGPDNKKRYTFYGQPGNVRGTDGIAGGPALGNIRLMVGYDRILPLGFTLGARIGYSFLGYPSPDDPPSRDASGGIGYIPPNSFLPLHFEARGGWMLAKDGVKKGMIIPHVFLGGGVGMESGSIPVTVCDTANNTYSGGAKCPDGSSKVTVDAYQITGQGFVDFGGGATYMIIDNFGIQAELKFMVQVPTVGFTFAPVIAPVVAF
jgi:hypothetical protein